MGKASHYESGKFKLSMPYESIKHPEMMLFLWANQGILTIKIIALPQN